MSMQQSTTQSSSSASIQRSLAGMGSSRRSLCSTGSRRSLSSMDIELETYTIKLEDAKFMNRKWPPSASPILIFSISMMVVPVLALRFFNEKMKTTFDAAGGPSDIILQLLNQIPRYASTVFALYVALCAAYVALLHLGILRHSRDAGLLLKSESKNSKSVTGAAPDIRRV